MSYSKMVWKCPYFKSDAKFCIRCECGRIEFGDRKSIQKYAEQYCGSIDGWQKCSLSVNRTDYYERKDKHEQEAEKKQQAGAGKA